MRIFFCYIFRQSLYSDATGFPSLRFVPCEVQFLLRPQDPRFFQKIRISMMPPIRAAIRPLQLGSFFLFLAPFLEQYPARLGEWPLSLVLYCNLSEAVAAGLRHSTDCKMVCSVCARSTCRFFSVMRSPVRIEKNTLFGV